MEEMSCKDEVGAIGTLQRNVGDEFILHFSIKFLIEGNEIIS